MTYKPVPLDAGPGQEAVGCPMVDASSASLCVAWPHSDLAGLAWLPSDLDWSPCMSFIKYRTNYQGLPGTGRDCIPKR